MANFNLPFGVRVSNNNPLDASRYIVSNISERDELITVSERAYNGLQVYVESDSSLYILKDIDTQTWEEVGYQNLSSYATDASVDDLYSTKLNNTTDTLTGDLTVVGYVKGQRLWLRGYDGDADIGRIDFGVDGNDYMELDGGAGDYMKFFIDGKEQLNIDGNSVDVSTDFYVKEVNILGYNDSQDASIVALRNKDTNIDTSLNVIWVKNDNQDASIVALRSKDTSQDASIILKADKSYVDASLNAKAPTSHASSGSTYGLASSGVYGHAKAGVGLSANSGRFDVEYGTNTNTACEGDDSRLSDARDPNTHYFTDTGVHQVPSLSIGHFLKATGAGSFGFEAHGLTYTDVGAAPINHAYNGSNYGYATTTLAGHVRILIGGGINISSGSISADFGTTSGKVCEGDDSRLSDARTPTSHAFNGSTYGYASGTNAGHVRIGTGLNITGGTTSVIYGSSSSTSVEGNDSRLTSFDIGGGLSTGLVPISGGGTTKYLRADGAWTIPDVSGGTGSGSAVNISGTPAQFQITTWVDSSTIKGNTNFIYDGANLGVGLSTAGARLHVYADLGPPSDLGDFDNYQLVIQGGTTTGDSAGMLFSTQADTYGGSAIVHLDTDTGGKGDLVFYTKQSTSAIPPSEAMRLDDAGDTILAGDLYVNSTNLVTYIDNSLDDIRATYIPDASLGTDFYWAGGVLEVSVGVGDVTQAYVDGSLALRDTSIAWLNANKLESSDLSGYATTTYVDGSLAYRDTSIAYLKNWNTSQDASINLLSGRVDDAETDIDNLKVYNNEQDVSIAWLNANKLESSDLSGYATTTYVNDYNDEQDVSIAWLNANKATLTGDSNNYLVTCTGVNKVLQGESGLTWTGTRFDVTSAGWDIANFNSTKTDYSRIRINGGAGCDTELSFLENGTSKLSMGWDAGDNQFKIRTGYGILSTNTILTVNESGDIIIPGGADITGNTDITGLLTVSNSSFPPAKITRTSTATNSVSGAFEIVHETTGNMTDGFGSGMYFGIKDSGADNYVAAISGVRDGNDTYGALNFSTRNAGGFVNHLTIDSDGSIFMNSYDNDNAILFMNSNKVDTNSGFRYDASTLHVNSTGSAYGSIYMIQKGNTYNDGITFRNAGDTTCRMYNNADDEFIIGRVDVSTIRISPNNDVGIGISPTARLHVYDNINNDFVVEIDNEYNGGWGLKVNVDGNAASDYIIMATSNHSGVAELRADGDWEAADFILSSDASLKENVVNLPDGLKKLLELRPVNFTWKDKRDEKEHIGFIAQEVEKIIPDVVKDNGEHKSISYGKITPVLAAGMQEMYEYFTEEIKKLKEEIEILKK